MKRLIKSAKFWTFIITQIISALTLFGGTAFHMSPDLVRYIIAFVEGLGAVLIASIAWEDAALKSAKGVKGDDQS